VIVDTIAGVVGWARGIARDQVIRTVAGDRGLDPGVFLEGDQGLFGPDSATWVVHGDPAMLVGGLRGLLLQTLHPLAMAGVADHSDYKNDPWGRLHRTGEYVALTTYGSTEQAQAAVERVRRIHRKVKGTAPDGRRYAASDPDLLMWVHTTEVDSFWQAYRRYGNRPRVDGDRYVAEMAALGELLGVNEPPRSLAAVASYLRDVRPDLRAGTQAREAVRFLVFPPSPLAARPPYALVTGAAVGLLPGWARRKLLLPSVPLTDPLMVRPAARTMLRSLGWVLGRPLPLEAALQRTGG
jgi:uncharacterized protein (DUF2236 family)